jgi:hypothetical protein
MNDRLYYLTSQKKNTNHILHLLLCIPTCGIWLLVWGITMRSNDRHNRKIDWQISQIMESKVPSAKQNSWVETDRTSKW